MTKLHGFMISSPHSMCKFKKPLEIQESIFFPNADGGIPACSVSSLQQIVKEDLGAHVDRHPTAFILVLSVLLIVHASVGRI